MDFKAKICYNRKTGQPIVFLPKRRFDLLKENRAKYLKVRKEDIL